MLATGCSLLLLAASNLRWIFLIPALLLISWRLDDTNKEPLVYLVELRCVLKYLFKEVEIFLRRAISVDEFFLLIPFLYIFLILFGLLLGLPLRIISFRKWF